MPGLCRLELTRFDIHTGGVYTARVGSKPLHLYDKRINVILPDTTLSVLDRVTTKGARSRLIDRAILEFVETRGKHSLRERLKREALANAERDLAIAAEWFPLEEEAWRTAAADRPRKKTAKTKRT